MAEFPRTDTGVRASRVRFTKGKRIALRVERSEIQGLLQVVSMPGGLVQVATQIQGTLSEISIETEFGPISCLVELLSAKRHATVFMQPFRFLDLDDGEAERLKQLLKSMGIAVAPNTTTVG
jgi:hypothetical protein